MRKRSLLCENIIGKPIIEANYADICFYDKENDNKIIVSSSSINEKDYPLSKFTPIGIVAVPSSHTEENRPRIASLAEMNFNTPDSGNVISHQYLYWGGYGYIITNLPTKNQYPFLERNPNNFTEDSTVGFINNPIYLASDDFSGHVKNPLNSLEGFYYSNTSYYYMCSPYKEDESKEIRYFDSSNTGNVLADFDGKTNTDLILEYDNSYSTDWQTASTITDEGIERYVHPAAQCCWRYYTDGTNKGDWYLPSAGELGYTMARQRSINLAINILNTQYNKTLGLTLERVNYWTSTQYSSVYAVRLYLAFGLVGYTGKSNGGYVRAFLSL